MDPHTNGLTAAANGNSNGTMDKAIEEIGTQAFLPIRNYNLSTQTVHADDNLNRMDDVAPAMHVATTFRYSKNPEELIPSTYGEHASADRHIYSRETAPNTTRLESILSSILHGPTVTYSSGLAAVHAAYVFLNPKKVSIGMGYHGCHGVLALHEKMSGMKILGLECAAEELGEGDVIHLETPLNPTGEASNIEHYAEKAHSRGAFLLVDATFGPPPLQDPFVQGADIVMHSGTKYFGGHSDMLCGVLAVNPKYTGKWLQKLKDERTYLGSVMGSLEGWLGVRSLRTLELRVRRQSENATRIVEWMDGLLHSNGESEDSKVVKAVVQKVQHASLQREDMTWLKKQMPGGFGPVFGLWMKNEDLAKHLPSKLELFHHATSLGGVESLIEWRIMSDSTVDRRVIRVSIGVENWEDLRDDFLRGFGELAKEEGKVGTDRR
ncbi:MAG: hypothetical protein MMC33_007482 [Icmadophila ericetorum]|nr:hypothetical protein [Icmadophila ericetorum]